MTIYWPSHLRLGIKYGAELTLGSEGGKVVTEMDYGPKKRRKRFTNAPIKLTVTVSFNLEEFEAFKSFYFYTLDEGVRSFVAPVLTGAFIEQKRVTIDDTTLPSQADEYKRWTVTMNLEIRDFNTRTPTEHFIIVLWGYDNFINYSDILQYEVNVHWPIIEEGIPDA